MLLELDENEKKTVKHALEVLEEELKRKMAETSNRQWRTTIHDEEYVIHRILKKVA